jgi:hypothetical protein
LVAEGTAEAGGLGLGISLDEDAWAGKLDDGRRDRESYDADGGSVVDWWKAVSNSHERRIVG